MTRNLLESGFLYEKYEDKSRPGMRLGRNRWLDGRSLAYMVENDAQHMGQPLVDQQWQRVLPILDQGQIGSCSGNAGTGALGTQPLYDQIGHTVLPSGITAVAAEQWAVQLYEAATIIDGYPGSYPPEDTGSSGLAICKVLKSRGLAHRYRWARTAYGLLRLLQEGPILQGMPWYNAFFDPKDGFIDADPGWLGSGKAGGHEVEAVAVEIDTSDAFNSVITYANSWGTSWGDNGYFRMRLTTYEQLSGVDIKQLIY